MKMKSAFARPINLRHGKSRRTKEPRGKSSDPTAQVVACQSLAEALAVRRLELDRAVHSYVEQREHKLIEIDGVFHHAYPDFLVKRFDSSVQDSLITEVLEIKHAGRRDSFEPVRLALEDAYARDNIGYRVIYSDALYRSPGRENVELALRYKNYVVSDALAESLVTILNSSGPLSWRALQDRCEFELRDLLALFAQGDLWIDVDAYFDEDAMISP
jgi:hypothetical protein